MFTLSGARLETWIKQIAAPPKVCSYGLIGDARMVTPPKYEADRSDGSNIDCDSGQQPSFAAQLRKTLDTIPAYTWYAVPCGTLTFVNERYADYLGQVRFSPAA